MKQLICLVLSLIFLDASASAEPDPQATAWVDSRLRAALRQSFGLESQIETLEVLEWSPNVAAFALDRRMLLTKNGLRQLRSASKDSPLEYVWNGASLRQDSRLETPLRIRFRIVAWVDRIAAQRDISLGEIIGAATIGPVKVAWRPAEPVDAKDCCQPEIFLGRRATRSLRQGAVLHSDFFVQAPLVTAGQLVTLISTTGGLALRTSAQAVQSGRAGELIFLKRVDNGVRLRGVIQADGTVFPYDNSESLQASAQRKLAKP